MNVLCIHINITLIDYNKTMNEQQYTFFASCAKGLEKSLESEINEKLGLYFNIDSVELRLVTGGIEFSVSLYVGCSLNEVLKIATRILLRIESFKVRDFPRLYNKAKKISWNSYLRGQVPSIESSAFQSRVFDSRKIESTLLKAINENYASQPPKKKYLDSNQELPPSSIYVRIDNDLCTISVDLSGERLDLRGHKLLSSNAPIRESLAAAMVYETKKLSQKSDSLLDLMCGSGSYSLESMNFYKRNSNRDYYFKWMPLYLKLPQQKNIIIDSKLFDKHVLNDLDSKTYKAVKENLAPFIDSSNCIFSNSDIFKLTNDEVPSSNNVIILNPPYGKRIKTDLPIRDFFKKLIKSIEEKMSPKVLGIIIPRELGDFKFKGNILKKLEFDNGGYPVIFYITGYNQTK